MYFRYNFYSNELDSCIVRCMIGEFNAVSASAIIRLPLNFIAEDVFINGDTNQGVNQNLADTSTTSPFIIPASAMTLSYFKYMNVNSKPIGSGNFRNHIESANSYDEYWNIGTGKNSERVEFVIELIDARTKNRICIIDSFGVLPNPASPVIQRYGANADQFYTSISLSGLPVGDTVKVRIIPKRWGPTPFGLALGQDYLSGNHSATVANVNGKIETITTQYADTLKLMYWYAIRDYYDSIITATGKLPQHLLDPPLGYEQQYFSRYYDSVGVTNYGNIYQTKYQLLAKLAVGGTDENTNSDISPTSLVITSVIPLPSSGGLITVIVNNTGESPITIQPAIYDLSGNKIECNSWHNSTLTKGFNTLTFNVKDVASGTYNIILFGGGNEVYTKARFIIQR